MSSTGSSRPMQNLPLVILAVQSSSKLKKKKKKNNLPSILGWWSGLLILLSSIAGLYDKNTEQDLIVNGLNGLRRPDRVPGGSTILRMPRTKLTLMPTSPFGERNHQSIELDFFLLPFQS